MTNITNLNKGFPDSFELVFPVLPELDNLKDSQSLSLNVYQTVIPSISIASLEDHWQGGKAFFDSGDMTYEPWLVNFMIDDNLDNWKIIFRWITSINNNKDRYGRSRDKYTVDASLNILNNERSPIQTINFKNVWPSMLGEVVLNYRESDSYLTSTCNFYYDRYELEEI